MRALFALPFNMLHSGIAVFASVAFSAGLASAQQSFTFSPGCQNVLTAFVTNPDTAACLNPSSLVSIMTNGGGSSIVDPVNSWLNGLCTSQPCAPETLASATETVFSGCKDDLKSLGLKIHVKEAIAQVQQIYPNFVRSSCLKDNNRFCLTETLRAIENDAHAPLTFSDLSHMIGKIHSISDVPSSVACSGCAKAAYNIFKQNNPPKFVSDLGSSLTSTCGVGFTDDTMPRGISDGLEYSNRASNQGPPYLNNAFGFQPPAIGIRVAALSLVSIFFVVFL